MSITIEKATFPEVVVAAKERCKGAPVLNLHLLIRGGVPRLDDPFVAAYREKAQAWQSPTVAENLKLTHGEYMHRSGDPIEYLVRELKEKPTSNRACVSLISMTDIVGSGDGKLPSFMLLQAGLDGKVSNVLYLTAYYRALEVESFLPINLTELALIANELASEMPQFDTVEFNVHAFRAHSLPNSRPLERSKLDIANPADITDAVAEPRRQTIVEWLEDKARPDTLVEIDNLALLSETMATAGWAPKEAVAELQHAVSKMVILQGMRGRASHASRIDELYAEIQAHIGSAVNAIMGTT